MAWPKDHKDKTKMAILTSASCLFASLGFKKVTIDLVMTQAGLTRGIFYTYFKSKADLYQQSISYAASATSQEISDQAPMNLSQIAKAYIEHNLNPDKRVKCPVAFLANDINHQDQSVRKSYVKVLEQFIKNIQSTGLEDEKAIQASIMLIGSVVISNAVDDESLQQKIINAALESF